MYHRILLAVDGSDTSQRALSHAIDLAKSQDASLLASYVVEYPSAVYSSAYFEIEPFREAVIADGRHALANAQFSMNEAGVKGQTRLIDPGLLSGGVADEIGKIADETKADVVVMGTHGRRGFRRLMMGSVAETFVRQSRCPVILVPHHEQAGFGATP
ncbi:universal stress protein [Bordetella sp. FB-8]|uniref:universal stress protein n=1 Tax=Bordetella sp. FB-8 TaxID=1159870 RepID=UPI000380D9D0|nr:universal stress protein [Bordetella sp. FB-8]